MAEMFSFGIFFCNTSSACFKRKVKIRLDYVFHARKFFMTEMAWNLNDYGKSLYNNLVWLELNWDILKFSVRV